MSDKLSCVIRLSLWQRIVFKAYFIILPWRLRLGLLSEEGAWQEAPRLVEFIMRGVKVKVRAGDGLVR